jgi:hypothetical protein
MIPSQEAFALFFVPFILKGQLQLFQPGKAFQVRLVPCALLESLRTDTGILQPLAVPPWTTVQHSLCSPVYTYLLLAME